MKENGMHVFLPLTKVEPQDDGSCIVEGYATVEELDAQGEVVLYDASKAAFSEMAEHFTKATDGASLGNLRAMHQPIAAGKLTAWWPDDAKKGIGVRGKVVDPAEVKKCRESVYTGFSVSAPKGMVKRSVQEWNGKPTPVVTEYHLSELSLVDKGAAPSALFSLVKVSGWVPRSLPDEKSKAATEALAKYDAASGGVTAAVVTQAASWLSADETQRATLQKDAIAAIAEANAAIAALKALAAELLMLPGEPDTWAITDVVYAIRQAIGGKIVAEQAALTAPPSPAVPGAGADEPAAVDGDAAIAAAAKPSEDLQKSLEKFATGLDAKLAAMDEGLSKAVENAVSKILEPLRKDLEARLTKLESQPAPVGTPVVKTLGIGAGGSSRSGTASLQKSVEDLEKTGMLSPGTQRELRMALATAMISEGAK